MATIDANKGKILDFVKIDDSTFLKDEINLTIPSWTPTGVDGNLVILNGETVQIVAGSFRDYSSVDIQLGGTLQIIDPLNLALPTQIYCIGSFSLEGQITCRNTINNGISISGTFRDGTPYSSTITQKIGGKGGTGGIWSPGFPGTGGTGGAGTNGFGGGGGGAGGNLLGGPGGSNNQPGTPANWGGGGTGGATLGNGTNGTLNFAGPGGGGGGGGTGGIVNPGGADPARSGGSGGGMKGKHGGVLYISSIQPIVGVGIINVSGTNGFNGGSGVNTPSGGNTGGGGGGGAGGSGGYLYLKTPSYSVSISINGGVGGAAGTTGLSPFASAGEVGNVGVLTIL